VRIPASPASGRVHGYSFIADRATLARGSLTLRQGSGWPAELAVAITLAAARGEDLAGKVVTNLPNRRGSPPITLRWREPDGRMAAESLRAGYVLRLEFGSVHDRSIEGKLYLATADAEKSFVGGTFRAEIRPAAAPRNLPAR